MAPSYDPDSEELTRAGPELTYRVPDDLDEDIWGGMRALSTIPTLKNTGSNSYVLFSACRSTELAKETRKRGFFSEALLKILNDLGPSAMSCSEIAHRLEKRVKESVVSINLSANRDIDLFYFYNLLQPTSPMRRPLLRDAAFLSGLHFTICEEFLRLNRQ